MILHEYFASRTTPAANGCIEWAKSRCEQGYGKLGVGKKFWAAHRYSYVLHIGEIPEGMTVDHLCFNPPCVNPDHLRLETHVDNCRRNRRSLQTHCKHGHEFTPDNTRMWMSPNGFPHRACIQCWRNRNAAQVGRVRNRRGRVL